MKSLNILRAVGAISFAGSLSFGALALADSPTAPAKSNATVTDPATLMKFEHVTVVNATPSATQSPAKGSASSAPGMRAYIDPATKQLRGATLEERAQEAASSKAKTLAAPNGRSRAAALAETEVSAPEVESLPNGLQAITLDESQMVYEVAHVDENGKARADCVGQQASGETALRVKVAPQGEHANEK